MSDRTPHSPGSKPAEPPPALMERVQARSLRRVFLELGDAQRQHRLRTGQHASPALRDAAFAFKRAPSLTSLAAVAGLLDEVGSLGW